MQYKTGTVTVTNGSATVTGSGTQWLNEIQAGHVFVRAQLVSGKRVDDPVVYTVAGVQSNTQLTLTAPYSGTSGSGQLYGITRDLTPMGKPLLAPSSIGTVPIFNEAVLKLEQQSNQIADDLGTAAALDVATTAQAIAGTAGVLPDAAGVHAAFKQFGVGITNINNNAPGDNLDTLRTNGIYRTAATTTGNQFGNFIGQCLHMGQAGNYAAQLFVKTQVSGGLSIKYRVIDSGNPSQPVELYHTGNTGDAVTRNVATDAQAIAGTAGVLPDAAGVHAAFKQFGLGGDSDGGMSQDWAAVGSTGKSAFVSSNVNGPLGSTVVQGVKTRSGSGVGTNFAGRNDRFFAQSIGNPWRELYHTGNIVGTVSQSGGVPTGAIIQRGSNANGEFVRYADGTQICTKLSVGTVVSVSAGQAASLAWVFPVAFFNVECVSANQVGFSQGDANSFSGIGTHPTINTQVTLSALNTSAGVRAFNPQALAIGRWY